MLQCRAAMVSFTSWLSRCNVFDYLRIHPCPMQIGQRTGIDEPLPPHQTHRYSTGIYPLPVAFFTFISYSMAIRQMGMADCN